MPKLSTLVRVPRKLGVARVLWRARRGWNESAWDAERHVREARAWLCRAQDATPDRGVAAWYALNAGWVASYPETTGYIIPTLLELARRDGDEGLRRRALEMADWELDVQLASGAVRGGPMNVPEAPAVFNTGQVLAGWLAAWHEAGQERHLEAARRAASWLVSVQDDDGAWRRHLSPLVEAPVQSYNARAAWGLALVATSCGEDAWRRAAERNGEWTLTRQDSAGWYADASFSPNTAPLLHTLAYVVEGLLELGALLDRDDFVDSARRAARALLEVRTREGALPGRLGPGWSREATWRCPTGEAQLALSCLRLHELDGERSWLDAGSALIREVGRTVALEGVMDEVRGAVPGSWPLKGDYLPSFLNWATKFFLDALLAEDRIRRGVGPGGRTPAGGPKAHSPPSSSPS